MYAPSLNFLARLILQETDDDLGSSWESSHDADEGNKDAARAKLRVKQKLDGYEEGELRSVQGQVSCLLLIWLYDAVLFILLI